MGFYMMLPVLSSLLLLFFGPPQLLRGQLLAQSTLDAGKFRCRKLIASDGARSLGQGSGKDADDAGRRVRQPDDLCRDSESSCSKVEFTAEYRITRREYSRGDYAQLEQRNQKPSIVSASMNRLVAPDISDSYGREDQGAGGRDNRIPDRRGRQSQGCL
jgi:hypothetical protein